MLFSLNFVKFMGNFVRSLQTSHKSEMLRLFFIKSVVFLLLLSTTINIWYLSKVSVLIVSKTEVVISNGICLTLWQ